MGFTLTSLTTLEAWADAQGRPVSRIIGVPFNMRVMHALRRIAGEAEDGGGTMPAWNNEVLRLLTAIASGGASAAANTQGNLEATAYPDESYAKSYKTMPGTTNSVNHVGHDSPTQQGGTSSQSYDDDADGAWHAGLSGTGASSYAGWVSKPLSIYLERLTFLHMRFRYDAIDLTTNQRVFHGLTAGTPSYSTPATSFDTAYAVLSAIGGTDTTFILRTRNGSTVTEVDTLVTIQAGVIYDAHFRYSAGSIYVKIRADEGTWSSEFSTSATLPISQALRVTSYGRVASPTSGLTLANGPWSLVTKEG